MFRRNMLLGLTSLPFIAILCKTATAAEKKSVTWTVPKDVSQVRVRSWDKDGNKVIDTNMSVNPDQVFKIDVVD